MFERDIVNCIVISTDSLFRVSLPSSLTGKTTQCIKRTLAWFLLSQNDITGQFAECSGDRLNGSDLACFMLPDECQERGRDRGGGHRMKVRSCAILCH